MKLDIDITPEQYRIVKDIINRFLPNTCKVWVFGSRAKDTAQDYSDLDLALDAGKEVDYDTIRQLKLAFEESRLPYTVDVVDLHSVEPYFKEIIDSQKVVFPLNRSLSDRDSDCIEGKGNVPELRFPGFSGEWVEKRIKDFGYFYYGKSAPKWSIKKGAKTPCIRYGELYTKFNVVVDKIYSYTNISTENLKFSKGGEVLVPRVGEDPKDFAKCCYLPFKDVAIGEMISVFNTKENGLFISCYFNTLYKEFGKMVEGASVSNLYFRYLEKIKLHLPSLPEQKKNRRFPHHRRQQDHPSRPTNRKNNPIQKRAASADVCVMRKCIKTCSLRYTPLAHSGNGR
jgi:predicted nucleotidyltransferase